MARDTVDIVLRGVVLTGVILGTAFILLGGSIVTVIGIILVILGLMTLIAVVRNIMADWPTV